MNNVYVRLKECDLRKIQEALAVDEGLNTQNLIAKIELLLNEMQPGTCLTLEAVKKAGCKSSRAG